MTTDLFAEFNLTPEDRARIDECAEADLARQKPWSPAVLAALAAILRGALRRQRGLPS